MVSSLSWTPELLQLSSAYFSPLDYFTDASKTPKPDVILIVDKEKFHCHRLLLSLASPVFSRMLDSEFKERDSHEIVLKGKSSESILELLKYIYPQFTGKITNDNVEDFLLLADEYMIDYLKQPCTDVLLEELQQFKYVSLPIKEKMEQVSVLSKKSSTATNSIFNSSRHQNDEPLIRNHRNRFYSTRSAPVSNSRPRTTKFTLAYSKSNDKNELASSLSSKNNSRYMISLDKTQLPMFYDVQNTPVPFTMVELESWLHRLRILYQIDKGRNYDVVIDRILSILQFIPTSILFSFMNTTISTYSIDELMLNDIIRARMLMLEEWASDGDSYRSVTLTDSYRTVPSSILALSAQQSIATSTNRINDELISFQETMLTDFD